MNKNITEVELNQQIVELKAKPDHRHVSGWSVIAFTPSVSIRCVKIHNAKSFKDFVESILAACDSENDEDYAAVQNAIDSITIN